MNYLCYDREILDKFGGIWKAFYELEEALTRTETDGEELRQKITEVLKEFEEAREAPIEAFVDDILKLIK